jgi:hypothetical protein
MRVISLSQPDMEILFAVDAIDREELIRLLREKLQRHPDYDRRKRLESILNVLAPKG